MNDKIIINKWSYDSYCISYDGFYDIEVSRLYSRNDVLWLSHLRDKTWFDKKCEKDFLEIFYIVTMLRNGKGF